MDADIQRTAAASVAATLSSNTFKEARKADSSKPCSTSSTTYPNNATEDSPFEAFVLPSGRTLAYLIHSVPLASTPHPPIFYFHGTPGTRIEAGFLSRSARALNLSIIGVDRPGLGHSSLHPGRTLLDWPGDVIALADHLGISRFGVIGYSGGCASAMACLYSMPRERLVAATVVSGGWSCAKYGTKGMMWTNKVIMWMAQRSTRVVSALTEWFLGPACREESRARLYEMMKPEPEDEEGEDDGEGKGKGGGGRGRGAAHPSADQKADRAARKNPEDRRIMVENMREALMNGCDGAAWDLWLGAAPWPFELDEVDVGEGRLTVWHGTADVNVPVTMADQAAKELKGVEYRRLDGEGHGSIATTRQEEALAELLGRL